ncbi:MAG: glycosyltransferase family 9 protein [Verrucomicrobia bacterium]|nr:glycosyltransferase family 9 protein [Verrucomicrobiota bacterium]
MRKILVLRGGALGDFIVTLPALALLRRRWPDARIELAGNTTAAALALSGGLLNAVHSQHEARWSALYGSVPFPAPLVAWFAEFDLILSFWPDPEGDLRRRFPVRAGQTFLHAGASPTRAPAAAHYCEALRPLGLQTENYFHALIAERRPATGRIALHPGSGSPRKNWPLERWAELGVWIAHQHHSELLIVTGEAEAPGVLAGLGTPAHNLPFPVLAAQLSRCQLFLGHDSGVSHLAAALGVPCVLLFGPTDPAMWAPPAPHVRVIRRGPEMKSISVDDVKAALQG